MWWVVMFPGLFQPWIRDQRRLNAESVGQLLRSSYVVGDMFPGLITPGFQDQRRLNAESVGQLLRSSYVVGDIFPGLKQPGAEFSERLRCYFTKGCEVLLTVSPINLDPVVAHFWDDAHAVVAGEDDVRILVGHMAVDALTK